MKTFVNQAAQGDVLVTRIDAIPNTAKKLNAENGKFVIAHSETGHHHTVVEKPGVEFYASENPLIAYLRVIDSTEVTLEHERNYDTHEALLIPGGTYEVRRQQEYSPEGWRRVAD